MKKFSLVLAGAVLVFAMHSIPTYAEKCEDHPSFRHDEEDCKALHIKVPETNSFMLLATGLVALGGLALVTRKKLAHSKQ